MFLTRKSNVNSAVLAIRAALQSGKAEYVLVSSRGVAIESALKVSDLVREALGGVSSLIRPSLQYCNLVRGLPLNKHVENQDLLFRNVDSIETFKQLITLPKG